MGLEFSGTRTSLRAQGWGPAKAPAKQQGSSWGPGGHNLGGLLGGQWTGAMSGGGSHGSRGGGGGLVDLSQACVGVGAG